LAPLLAPGALVLSMQNGVDNVEQIRAAAAIEALPAVVYVAASVPEPGRVKHVGRVIWSSGQKTRRQSALRHFFRAPRCHAAFRRISRGALDQTDLELRSERSFALGAPSMD